MKRSKKGHFVTEKQEREQLICHPTRLIRENIVAKVIVIVKYRFPLEQIHNNMQIRDVT
jgi:hypothetical protein